MEIWADTRRQELLPLDLKLRKLAAELEEKLLASKEELPPLQWPEDASCMPQVMFWQEESAKPQAGHLSERHGKIRGLNGLLLERFILTITYICSLYYCYH